MAICILMLCLVSLAIFSQTSNADTVSPASIPSSPIEDLPAVQGIVYSSALDSDSSIYIGGEFTQVGGALRNGAYAFSSQDPNTLKPFPLIDEAIKQTISDGSGGYYIGGEFNLVGATTIYALAHILSNGTLDTNFNVQFSSNAKVNALAYDSNTNTLYAGGRFSTTTNGSITRNNIVAVNGTTGTTVSGFDPDVNDEVLDIELDGTTIYAAGSFNTVNSSGTPTTRNHVAAFSTTTGIVNSFDVDTDSRVNTIALNPTDDILYIAGYFQEVNNNSTPIIRNRVAAINTVSNTVLSFDPNFDSQVNTIVLSPDTTTLYAGGSFSHVNSSTEREGLAAITTANGTATAFDPQLSYTSYDKVSSLFLDSDNNQLFVGGHFYTVNGLTPPTARNDFAVFSTAGSGEVIPIDPKFSSFEISSVFYEASSDTIIASGDIYGVGGTRRNHAAKLKSDGTLDPTFNPDLNGSVMSYLVDEINNTVYLTGSFTAVNITTSPTIRNHIAAFDMTTGALKPFNPSLGNGDFRTMALDTNNNVLYVGGSFTSVNTLTTPVARNNIAAFDTSTGVATSFNPDVNNIVYQLLLSSDSNTLYAGGNFQTVNNSGSSLPREYVAAFNTNTGIATLFRPALDGTVYSIALSADDSTLYAAGDFTQVNTNTSPLGRNYVASFTTSNSQVTNFDASPNNYAIRLQLDELNNVLYVGGLFQSMNTNAVSAARNNVAAVDSSSGAVTSFNPNIIGYFSTFIADTANERLFAGGFLYNSMNLDDQIGGLTGFGVPLDPATPEATTTTTTTSTASTPSSSVATSIPKNVEGVKTVSIGKVAGGSIPLTGKNSQTMTYSALLIICIGLALRLRATKKVI